MCAFHLPSCNLLDIIRLPSARNRIKWFLLLACLLWGYAVCADALKIEVRGVDKAAAANVQSQLGGGWLSGSVLSSARRQSRFIERAEKESVIALRPFGYYFANAFAELRRDQNDSWLLTINIEKGEPVTVRKLVLELNGPGSGQPNLVAWKQAWPLSTGSIMVQPVWDEQKESFADLAKEDGYLLAGFVEHRIELDLESNQADLFMVVDTGPRAVLGEITFEQDFVDESVLTPVSRFQPGDFYRGWLVDQFRTDLWKLAFFEDIHVTEIQNLKTDPPVVDLHVVLQESHKNSHQGTLGVGTDTDFRMQYRWQRHLLSERGDSFSVGFGWQSRNEELRVFGEYRLPRRVDTHQYWLINPVLNREDQEFELEVDGRDEKIPVGSGRVNDLFLRVGRAKLRNPVASQEQIVETIFISYLSESGHLDYEQGLVEHRVRTTTDLAEKGSDSVAIGMEWTWPVITGRGFSTSGHREKAIVFTSNEAWGSDINYNRAYVSSRWNFLLGDKWKLLVRGELGISDAKVKEVSLDVEDIIFQASITELPYQYRFKAGGSHSVRGYDFESLSNNGIGSNNIITASAEVEYLFRDNWSVAAFVDTGNAFNDWGNPSLRTGIGVGIRWYTLAFPIRLDVAQARDIEGNPWRFHLTIGSPLL